MTTFEFAAALRAELILLLQGPGVTWNLKGIEHQLDKAIATVALKYLDMPPPARPGTMEYEIEQANRAKPYEGFK